MQENVRHVQLKFSRNFHENENVSWSPSSFEEFLAFDAANRLFTDTKAKSSSVQFVEGMDPRGVLQDLVDQKGFYHLEENQVRFYELKEIDGKKE